MKSLKEEFLDILEKQRIKPVFQPIVSLTDGKVIGYEALSRVINPKEISSSEELFTLAGIYGKIWELERLCRMKILEKYDSFKVKDDKKLFINVNPMVIHDNDFHTGFTKGTLSKYGIRLENVVYEITERNASDDIKSFKDTIRHYKDQGYTIAVDDAGTCYSGLNLICDIAPHYLKLDMSLIQGIYKDNIKKAMVKSLVEFSNLTGSQLIAEGIENEDELKTLLKLGVHNGQGYYLCKPYESLRCVDSKAQEIIQKFWQKKQKQVEKNNRQTIEYRVVLFHFECSKAFFAYCDQYGDEAGNNITKLIEEVIIQNLREEDKAINIGAEGILVIFNKENYKIVCETIVKSFNERVKRYYSSVDLEKECIVIENKNRGLKKYPIISIQSERLV